MPSTWPLAAQQLARAVTRRERLGALLTSCGAGTLTGSVAAWVLGRFAGTPPAWLPVAGGLLLGLVHGVLHARRVTAADLGAAAWALDRLGEAGEAGLASALGGTQHAAPPPPRTRLKPVAGLPLALGAALAAGLALGLDARAADPSDPAGPVSGEAVRVVGSVGPEPSDARTTESRERRAAEATRVRLALGLTSDAPPSAAALAERLQDPAARAAARSALQHDVVEADGALARALAAGPEAAAELAHGLAQGASEGALLEAERRAALAAATATAAPVVGASRRALIERHAALLRAQGVR